jgi:preprotein translocase subunit SecA
MTRELIDEIVDPITIASRFSEEWDLDTLNEKIKPISPSFSPITYTAEEFLDITPESLKEDIYDQFEELYQAKEAEIGIDKMRELERMILIRVVDNKWMDHIDDMDQLKNGIGLRALGQQDPAAAYAQEGFDMFELMIQSIKEDTVKFCYSVTEQTNTTRKNIMGTGESKKDEYSDEDLLMLQAHGDEYAQEAESYQPEEKPEPFRRDTPKVGRNDPCPCGSGKKYKNCCGRNG